MMTIRGKISSFSYRILWFLLLTSGVHLHTAAMLVNGDLTYGQEVYVITSSIPNDQLIFFVFALWVTPLSEWDGRINVGRRKRVRFVQQRDDTEQNRSEIKRGNNQWHHVKCTIILKIFTYVTNMPWSFKNVYLIKFIIIIIIIIITIIRFRRTIKSFTLVKNRKCGQVTCQTESSTV